MSDVAVGAILEANPDAKFVALVRDPLELIPSYFQTQQNAANEDETSLAIALRLTAGRRNGLGGGLSDHEDVLG